MEKQPENPLLDFAYKAIQDCLASFPVIVLGSGHSRALDIPDMPQLAEHLRATVPSQLLPEDRQTWELFEEKIKNKSLEATLNEITLSPALTDIIIRKTWDCISFADKKVLEQIVHNRIELPLSQLYGHLFDSTHNRLSLITTNYDCLAEYAADIVGYAWATGFGYGYIGKRYGNCQLTVSKGNQDFRTVDIWKVHGSINWYRSSDGALYSLPSFASPPSGYAPIIVTPGIDKYRQTHAEPFRTIISGADAAIEAGESFLCIGYGFSDEHIQPKLLDKCKKERKRIVIITKTLTENAKKVLLDGECHCFVAFEEIDKGTRMYEPKHLAGVELEGQNFWSLSSLLSCVS